MNSEAVVLDHSQPVAAYRSRYVERIVGVLERAPKPLTALDFSCGDGFAALALLPHLPPGTRVVAIDEDRNLLRRFHAKIRPSQRPSLFVRKEGRRKLPFDEQSFDLAWASLAARNMNVDARRVLVQVFRALRAPGQLLLATPLRETVVELMGAITPLVAGGKEPGQALVDEDTVLASADDWLDEFRKLGAVDVGVARETIVVRLERPVANHPIFIECVLPLWVGDSNPFRKELLDRLDDTLDTPLDVPVHIGCVYGRKPRGGDL